VESADASPALVSCRITSDHWMQGCIPS